MVISCNGTIAAQIIAQIGTEEKNTSGCATVPRNSVFQKVFVAPARDRVRGVF